MALPCCSGVCKIPARRFAFPPLSNSTRHAPQECGARFVLFCDSTLHVLNGTPVTLETRVPYCLLVFDCSFVIKPPGFTRPRSFVTTLEICRGHRARRLLAFASPRENLMIRTAQTLFATFLLLLLPAIAFAQGGVATGDLHVTVKDAKGNLVTNATVTARDVAKGLERAATGDGQGGYSVRQLPPASYSVTIETPGFTKVENTNVIITVGGTVELPVALEVAGGREVVEVTSQADLVETSRSSK